MDKILAEFLSIAMLGAFLYVVFFVGNIAKKKIINKYGEDFFVKNKAIIRKYIVIIIAILGFLGFCIGLYN